MKQKIEFVFIGIKWIKNLANEVVLLENVFPSPIYSTPHPRFPILHGRGGMFQTQIVIIFFLTELLYLKPVTS